MTIFGAHNLSNVYEAGRFSLSPVKIYIHDDWNPSSTQYDGDLSLLKFEDESIHFNSFVRPICFWGSGDEPTEDTGVVVGWGESEDKTKNHENLPTLIQVLFKTNEQCFLTTKTLVDLSSIRTFCAGSRNGSGVCSGDSGGGLFIIVDDRYFLKGIVSSSLVREGRCDISKDAIYTNVLKFRNWIGEITGSMVQKYEVEP